MKKKEKYIFINLDKIADICTACKHKNSNEISISSDKEKIIHLENIFFYSKNPMSINLEIECIIKNLNSKCIKNCIKKSNTFCIEEIENLVILSLQQYK